MNYSSAVQFGSKEITFAVSHVDRRTMEIAVHPSGNVAVKAPLDSEPELVRAKVLKRAKWILKQQLYFDQFHPRTPQRQYLGGETHLYLGRQYRLKIVQSEETGVKLYRGRLEVRCGEEGAPQRVAKLLKNWYREKAREVFREEFLNLVCGFNIKEPQIPHLQIRVMKTRWGSLSENGTLTLNADLIRAPKECIEYVIMHELCHLQFHDHSTDFYKLLNRKMPDWEKRKAKLEAALV